MHNFHPSNLTFNYTCFRLSDNSIYKQPGGFYKLKKDGPHWYLLHRVRDIMGHHREELNRVVNEETWQVVHRFDTQARELSEFQERCDQYQTDPEVMLAVMPICIRKAEEGQVVNAMTGRRLTMVRFKENIDVRSNEIDLTDAEIDKKLKDVFGIHLQNTLNIVEIVENLNNEEG